MGCPYSSEELDYWDGVSNPMGDSCTDCEEYNCEHNPNPDPFMPGPEDNPWLEQAAEHEHCAREGIYVPPPPGYPYGPYD